MITEPLALNRHRWAGMSAATVVDSLIHDRCGWPHEVCPCREALISPESVADLLSRHRRADSPSGPPAGELATRRAAV